MTTVHRVFITIIFSLMLILAINVRVKNSLIQEAREVESLRQKVNRLSLIVRAQLLRERTNEVEMELRFLESAMCAVGELEMEKIQKKWGSLDPQGGKK